MVSPRRAAAIGRTKRWTCSRREIRRYTRSTAGSIAKLFTSKAGGLTIYQFDPAGRLCYYYAHLERYADGLKDGQTVSQGDVIGYVGTTGNAPANTPHLHFAVFELNADKHWWQGRAIDPYRVFKDRG